MAGVKTRHRVVFIVFVKLVSRILIHRVQVDFLRRNREEFVFAFDKRSHFSTCLRSFVLSVRTVVLVHHFISDAPTAKVKPAVAFHSKFHTAFVADCLAQVVRIVAIAVIVRECRKNSVISSTGTLAHFFQRPFGTGNVLTAFKSSFGIHQQHIGSTNQTIVDRAAGCVVKRNIDTVFDIG